ncbi:response regulator [candidate division WOR-3 bacterium]|nr:response regulator [candidate division WOR-3 bacterium]
MTPINPAGDDAPVLEPGLTKKRILICDDEEPIRLLLAEALQDSYDIVEAANGRDALRLATKEHIDLIIIDIKMPQVHGLEAIERIRERDSNVPIIICSAYPLMEDDIVVKTSDIAAFITKPIDIESLKSRITELIGR